MTPDGTLVIRNMERKDGGVYGCLASNQAGTDSLTSSWTYIGESHRSHTSSQNSICSALLSFLLMSYCVLSLTILHSQSLLW